MPSWDYLSESWMCPARIWYWMKALLQDMEGQLCGPWQVMNRSRSHSGRRCSANNSKKLCWVPGQNWNPERPQHWKNSLLSMKTSSQQRLVLMGARTKCTIRSTPATPGPPIRLHADYLQLSKPRWMICWKTWRAEEWLRGKMMKFDVIFMWSMFHIVPLRSKRKLTHLVI